MPDSSPLLSISNALGNLGSLGVFLIWAVYAQLFYSDFRRRRKPRLLLAQAKGYGSKAVCMLVNMSQETIYFECAMAELRSSSGKTRRPITFLRSEEEVSFRRLRQGALQPGTSGSLAAFRDILNDLDTLEEAEKLRKGDSQTLWLEIQAAAIYGADKHPVGVRRTFMVTPPDGKSDEFKIRPLSTDPENLSSRKQRQLAQRWIEESIGLEQASQ